jgi:two-component system CheB/CheR fusion protein
MAPARKKSAGRGGAGNRKSARSDAAKRRVSRDARPRADAGPAPSREPRFPIVGIGGSAGALPALQDFFGHVPADCGLAFVVIVHTDPHAPSLLPELLGRCTRMPVLEAASGQRVQASRVYVAPPGHDIRIEGGVLLLDPVLGPRRGVRLPIDIFFRSLAQDQGHRAVGIVVSGTGADGTLGLGAIRAEAGLVLAQDGAEFEGMPGSAIAAGVVDLVLPASEMPGRLLAHAGLLATPEPALESADGGEELDRILALVNRRTGRDFSSYKPGTLRRRAERRMRLQQLEQLSDYVRVLEANPGEVDALWRDWLIGVSRFFRDPEVFDLLAAAELRNLIDAKPEESTLRVWVPGCATGEEAYSLGILVLEVSEQLGKRIEIQIFASDLDPRAIDLARGGRYPEGIATDMSEGRLRRFFQREERGYRVKKELRDLIVFAVQDVLRDPPFTRTDLISCRNLLIYLNAAAQRRLLPLFHYSLNPGGLLLLGTSESATGFEGLFAAADQHAKLYRRKEGAAARPLFEWAGSAAVPIRPGPAPRRPAPAPKLDLADLLRRSLTERYAPPAVIIDERGEIEHVHGHTGSYLEPAPGRASLNVVEMAREGLHAPLAAAIRQVVGTDAASARKSARVRSNGGFAPVEISVRRLRDPRLDKPMLLVSFESGERAGRRAPGRRSPASDGAARGPARRVEEELRTARADLQSTIEELQGANEELASANEEVQSVNEELQSSNEELQTSKEETQSLNEELQTLNSELTAKLHDLEEAQDDLVNFINSTDIAMIFLDGELRVKRFTPAAQRIFRLIASDVGRPLADLTSSLDYPDLLADAEHTLETLVPTDREVRASDGSWYAARTRLYRTSSNAIEGLVLLFTDVTRGRWADEAARAQLLAESIVDTVREPLLVLDGGLRVVRASRAFYRAFRVFPEQTEGQLVYELGGHQWDIPRLRELLEHVLPNDHSFDDFEVVHDFPAIGRRRILLNARQVVRGDGSAPDRILLAFQDVTQPGVALPPSVGPRP